MSNKTTFKRIALAVVAALGFGVLATTPSSATISGLTVTGENGKSTLSASSAVSDSTTAATITISALIDNVGDTITVDFVQKSAPSGATAVPRLYFMDTTTPLANTTVVDTASAYNAAVGHAAIKYISANDSSVGLTLASANEFRINAATAGYVGAKFAVQLDSESTRIAGTYTYTVIVKSYNLGSSAVPAATTTQDVSIVIAAAAVPVPAAANAKAYMQLGNGNSFTGVVADSVVTGTITAGTVIGEIYVANFTSANATANDTITVSMTGAGTLSDGTTRGRSFTVANVATRTFDVEADGQSGTGTVTITTAAGASFVKTVTFFDNKPATVTAKVEKAYIKAGTTEVAEVFAVTVKDAAGNDVTNATITAAATDTATTVGGAATCGTYDTTDKVYYCGVKGLSATKFGPVEYTITATGVDAAKTKVTAKATTTFADNVAVKAVLSGPETGDPGATVTYKLTLTEKNGYPVADQTYGANSAGGVLFASRTVSGWTTAPFATTDSFTSVSGVIESKGVLPTAGTATGTWTLVGDGLQTLAANAIDKTIGKTDLKVSTLVFDAAKEAAESALDAAQEATDAAIAATDAAILAQEAADEAASAAIAAQETAQAAVDAVTALSAEVTKLVAQLATLQKLLNRVAKRVGVKL